VGWAVGAQQQSLSSPQVCELPLVLCVGLWLSYGHYGIALQWAGMVTPDLPSPVIQVLISRPALETTQHESKGWKHTLLLSPEAPG